MAKLASKTQATSHEQSGMLAVPFPMDRFLNDNGQSIEAWRQVSKTLMESLGALQVETTRFMAKRFEEDLERQRGIAACRSPSEMFEIYNAFTRKAMRDFLEEATKMSDIAADIGQACTAFGETITASAIPSVATNDGQRPAATSMTVTAKPEDAKAEIAA